MRNPLKPGFNYQQIHMKGRRCHHEPDLHAKRHRLWPFVLRHHFRCSICMTHPVHEPKGLIFHILVSIMRARHVRGEGLYIVREWAE